MMPPGKSLKSPLEELYDMHAEDLTAQVLGADQIRLMGKYIFLQKDQYVDIYAL
jgi:hypothetical protein